MTEKRLRKGPPGTARRPRCEDMFPFLDNPSRTRFRTSDNVLFDVANNAVTPSRVMARVISEARRAAETPRKIEQPPALPSFSDSGLSHSAMASASVSLRHDPHLLPNVAAEPLEVALQYCYFHTSPNRLEMTQASRTAWDNEFVQVSPRRLCELASAAYYLDICDLVDLTCRAIAAIISGKTADQIRSTFHIENDLVQTLVFPNKLKGTAILSHPPRRRDSKKAPPPSTAHDLVDSDEQDSYRAANTRGIPQLGRNTVEEVENWINGDGNSKKTSKKRRKRKKNKALSTPPECPGLETPSLSTSITDNRSPTSSRGLPADNSPSHAQIHLTEESQEEQPILNNASLLPTETETQQVQQCQTLISTSSSSDDEVTLVCMATGKEVGRAKARIPTSSGFTNSCNQKDPSQSAEPSSPPSSPPPPAGVSQGVMEGEVNNVSEGLLWSTVPDGSGLAHSEEDDQDQGRASPQYSRDSAGGDDQFRMEPESNSSKVVSRTKPRIRKPGEGDLPELIASKSAYGREQHESSGSIGYDGNHVSSTATANRSTNCGVTTVSQLGVGREGDFKSGFHPRYDSTDKRRGGSRECDESKRVLIGRSTRVDPKGVEDLHPGVGNLSYIRCPTRMDKEVADFESRLRIADDEAEPNGFYGHQQSEALRTEQKGLSVHQTSTNQENRVCPDNIFPNNLDQVEIRPGEPAHEGFIQNRLRAVRREAQLMERQKHLQQRADALDKQITDLHAEREKVRSELSIVAIELGQYQEETEV